jgi:hypothetical protein
MDKLDVQLHDEVSCPDLRVVRAIYSFILYIIVTPNDDEHDES